MQDQHGRIPVKSWQEIIASSKEYTGMTNEDWLEEVLSKNSLNDLNKSFYTSYTPSASISRVQGAPNSLQALMRENLDSTMVDALINESNLTLLNSMPRVPTPTIHSEKVIIKQRGVGAGRGYASFAEGTTPKLGSTDRFERKEFFLKQFGVRGGVPVWAEATQMIYNAMALEYYNRAVELLKQINWQIVFGDSSLNKGLEFDGLLKIMEDQCSTHIIDLEGEDIALDDYYKAIQMIVGDGKIDDITGRFHCVQPHSISLKVAALMTSVNHQRSVLEAMIGKRLMPDGSIPGIFTTAGYLPFINTNTLQGVENKKPITDTNELQISSYVPKLLSTMTCTIEADTTSTEIGSIKDGYYIYWISASNGYGESEPLLCQEKTITTQKYVQITSATRRKVNITIPNPLIVEGIISWKIYRVDFGNTAPTDDEINSSKENAEWIATIPAKANTENTYVDNNQVIPGAEYIIIKSTDPNDISLAQLLPLMSKNIVAHSPDVTTNDFLLFLICALQVWVPERVVIIKNAKGLELES